MLKDGMLHFCVVVGAQFTHVKISMNAGLFSSRFILHIYFNMQKYALASS